MFANFILISNNQKIKWTNPRRNRHLGEVVLTHLNLSPQSGSVPPVETSCRCPWFYLVYISFNNRFNTVLDLTIKIREGFWRFSCGSNHFIKNCLIKHYTHHGQSGTILEVPRHNMFCQNRRLKIKRPRAWNMSADKIYLKKVFLRYKCFCLQLSSIYNCFCLQDDEDVRSAVS